MKYCNIIKNIFLALLLLVSFEAGAREILTDGPKGAPDHGSTLDQDNSSGKTTANCAQASAFTDIDINNVRARIYNGGDMWWDRGTSTASYEVPKGSGKNSLFAGSVWIGGYDAGGNLKVAAQTYRQFGGNDYWPGPLNNSSADIDEATCARWDKIWKINATEITDFISAWNNNNNLDIFTSQWENIRLWPAYGNPYLTASDFAGKTKGDFAPFVDVDSNGIYDVQGGDYPAIKGDQYLWWIFNDAGGIKTETSTPAIGMEVHGSAFAFVTNDQLNNATFYSYTLINRSNNALDSCTISTWTDADLGYFNDDYVGCDTTRSLGILYNGSAFDGSGLPSQYGADIPMVGIDFFEGPKAMVYDADSGKLVLKELGMTSFVFYNNDNSTDLGNPNQGIEFYRYMTGTMRSGREYTQTCNAVDPSVLKTKFVYWGDPSAPGDLLTNWTECGCNNQPGDRRFVHSSGPFRLEAGADPIKVTIGAIWADNFNYPCPSFSGLQIADDKAQVLFDRNFVAIQPPNAPILTIRELDKQLVLFLDNPESSNNYNETYGTVFKEYATKGINLGLAPELCTYMFEGYKIFQVKDSTTTTGDIYNSDGTVNTDVARLAFQCDVKNGVSDIYNYVEEPSSIGNYFARQQKVEGSDKGIQKSFVVTNDLFATGSNTSLVNYKRYYFIAVAYAYNEFRPFDPASPQDGQNEAYLESFKNGLNRGITPIEGIPNAAYTNMGNQTRANYGDGVVVHVMEGVGNGGNFLIMSQESENQALTNSDYQASDLYYEQGSGPISVTVVDPIKVPSADFELWMTGINYPNNYMDTSKGLKADSSSWFLISSASSDTIFAESNLASVSDQILQKYGLAVKVYQVSRPGDDVTDMGFIKDTIIYDDNSNQWLSGVKDQDGRIASNWIRSGIDASAPVDLGLGASFQCDYRDFELPNGNWKDGQFLDPNGIYEKVLNGTWAPYVLLANDPKAVCGFALQWEADPSKQNTDENGYFNFLSLSRAYNSIKKIRGVDIVFTADRSKWSKCAVVEMRDPTSFSGGGVGNATYAEGGALKFNLRNHASVIKEANGDGNISYTDPSDYGTSWFPGYAINVETGERLNIFFGEDSYLKNENGRDMIWNPTNGGEDGSGLGEQNPITFDREALFGGKHAIYVSKTKYDECADIIAKLKADEAIPYQVQLANKRKVYQEIIWAGLPLVKQSYKLTSWKEGLIPTTTRIRIRTALPYQAYTGNPAFSVLNNGNPRYRFSTKDLTMVNSSDLDQNGKQEALKKIRVVPNPYYAYSAYEWNRLDNRVKIINLPNQATIKIYSLDGVLIRTLTKSDQSSFIDWDLKNSSGIMISGGAYLMHVEAKGLGDIVLKWFAAIRPTDITTF